jgi:GTP-binding protein
VSYQVVLTKADKPLSADVEKALAATRAAIAKRPAAHPHVLLTSSEKGTGIKELRTEIAMLLESGGA